MEKYITLFERHSEMVRRVNRLELKSAKVVITSAGNCLIQIEDEGDAVVFSLVTWNDPEIIWIP
jgi:hypothetical protein